MNIFERQMIAKVDEPEAAKVRELELLFQILSVSYGSQDLRMPR
jgi:hypothetical protein